MVSEWAMFGIGVFVGIIIGAWLAWQACRIRFSAWMAEGWGILARAAAKEEVKAEHVAAVFGADTIRGQPL